MQKKQSILFLIGNFGVGGKERQLAELIKGLPKDRYEIHLFAKSTEAYYFKDIQALLTSCYSLDQPHFRLSDVWRLARYINKIRPDVVFSFAVTPSHFALLVKWFGSHQFILINGSIRNAPVILSFTHRIERRLYAFYHSVVANSHAGLKAYKQYGKKGRFVMYNGFNLNRIPAISKKSSRNLSGFKHDDFIIMMVAALTGRKDQQTFIRAAQECLKHDSHLKFYLVGEGETRTELVRLTQALGLEDAVEFLGVRNDVEYLLIAADISVLTSADWHGEGISNSILESLACGTPVIATDNGGTREILEDGKNGYLIENGDFRALAEKILYLKQHPQILHQFGNEGKNVVREKFGLDSMIRNFGRIIEEARLFA